MDNAPIFASSDSEKNWYQVQFPSEIYAIVAVEIYKRNSTTDRFHHIEARIGDGPWKNDTYYPTLGYVPINVNKVCSYFGEAEPDNRTAWFQCSERLNGTFLTLQQLRGNILEMDEIYVYGNTTSYVNNCK